MANMEHGADERRAVRQRATQSTTDCTADWSRHFAVKRGKVVFHWGRDLKCPKSWKRFAMALFTCLPGCVSVWVASNIQTIVATICGARVFDMCVRLCECVCLCVYAHLSVIHALCEFLLLLRKEKRKLRKNVSRFNGRSCGFNAISHNKWPSWRHQRRHQRHHHHHQHHHHHNHHNHCSNHYHDAAVSLLGHATRATCVCDVLGRWPALTIYNTALPLLLSLSPSLSLFLFHHVAQWTDKCNYVAVLCVLGVCVCVWMCVSGAASLYITADCKFISAQFML